MVESASINKSLFVLAQCVEAISKKQARIPYRESKMTRILSLGQNNGLTVMILNLAPVRSYHLDTLSSLNFANRTKKIEVNEVENKPFFRMGSKTEPAPPPFSQAQNMNRQPLRPKVISHNVVPIRDATTKAEKPVKAFSVYADKEKPANARPNHLAGPGHARSVAEPQKRTSSEAVPTVARPSKLLRPSASSTKLPRIDGTAMTQQSIEALIERKVAEKLAEKALNMQVPESSSQAIPADVQARLDALELRIGSQESGRAEGLQYLLMAKQHVVRGEDASALKMYQLALPFFPDNEKLAHKMLKLQEKLDRKAKEWKSNTNSVGVSLSVDSGAEHDRTERRRGVDEDDEEYQEEDYAHEEDDGEVFEAHYRSKSRKPRRQLGVYRDTAGQDEEVGARWDQQGTESEDELAYALALDGSQQTPRSKHILRVINTRDVAQIRLLRGVGAKKAEMIVNCLCEMDEEVEGGERGRMGRIRDINELGSLKGVGAKGVERMREGVNVAV